MQTFLVAAVSFVLVLCAAAVAAYIWWELGDVEMSSGGIVALIAGIVATLALGIGLMRLVYYSHKRGYDDDVR